MLKRCGCWTTRFQGNASNYVIYSDGRVVIDNSVNRKKTIYNFIAMLRDHSDLYGGDPDLSNAFAQGRSGNMKVKLGDTEANYLVWLRCMHGGPELDDGGACPVSDRQCQSG